MATKKAKKKVKPSQLKRYYGLTKIKRGAKFAWFAQENKHGWAVGFAMNDRTVWLRNLRFASREEVERLFEKSSVVFIPLKHNAK